MEEGRRDVEGREEMKMEWMEDGREEEGNGEEGGTGGREVMRDGRRKEKEWRGS